MGGKTVSINGVLAHVATYRGAQIISLEVGRLIEGAPSLKQRAHEKYLRWEMRLADEITGRSAKLIAAAMAAAVAVAGLRTAVSVWLGSQGRDDFAALTRRAYAALTPTVGTCAPGTRGSDFIR